MSSERMGIIAIFDVAKFTPGVQQYIQGLQKADASSMRFEKGTAKIGKGTQFLDGVLKGAAGQMGKFGAIAMGISTGGLATLGMVVGSTLVQAFGNLAGKVREGISGLMEFGVASLHTAGRVDELERAALLLGVRSGQTQEATQGFLDGLADLGIRADVSANLVSQLARRNLDLAQSTELASIAQNAAVLVGQDSSETLDRIIHGITTYNARVLRTAGLNVNMMQAQDALARSLGKTREELDASERTQAALNAVIAEGANIQGVYSVAMESPTKALRSLGREIFNLKAALGAPFLEAWNNVVVVMRHFVQMITKAVQEGGALYPVLVNLGALASVVTEGFAGLAEQGIDAINRFASGMTQGMGESSAAVTGFGVQFDSTMEGVAKTGQDAVIRFGSDFANGLADAASDAFTWGVEIVASLAEGLISGAVSALTAAMDYIGSILTWWLGPGSPPRVAPHLDEWGAAAFTEFLKGFEDADFGVLSGLQSILGRFMEETDLQQWSLDIAQALAEGPDAEFFERLKTAAGDFGEEVAELARNYFAMNDAVKAVAAAERQLNQAQEAVVKATGKVGDLTDEYNQLLRAGASESVLDAKLAEINAAEEELTVAQKQAKLAEQAEKDAKEHVETLKEESNLQEELVRQLLKLAGAEEEAAAAAGGGAGGRGRRAGGAAGVGRGLPRIGAGIGAGMGAGIGEGLTTAMGDAIDRAKEDIRKRLTDLLKPLTDAWIEIQKDLDDLSREWSDFIAKPEVQAALKILADGVVILKLALEGLWLFVKDNLKPILVILGGVLLVTVVPALFAALAPIAALGTALLALGLLWQQHGEAVKQTMERIPLIIAYALNEAAQAVTRFVENFGRTLTQLGIIIVFKLNQAAQFLRTWLSDFITTWQNNWNMALEILALAWQNIVTAVTEKAQEVYTAITDKIQEVVDWLSGMIETFRQIGSDIILGLKQGILDMAGELIDAITGVIEDAIEAAKALLGESSESKVFRGIGKQAMAGYESGLLAQSTQVREAIQVAMQPPTGAQVPVPAPAVVGGATTTRTTTNTATVNMGGVNINDGMDAALFEERVLQVVEKAMGR